MMQFSNARALAFTAVAVVFMAVPLMWDLLSEDSAAVAVTESASRLPSSVAGSRLNFKPAPSVNRLVEWNCNSKTKTNQQSVSLSQVRLRGNGCGRQITSENLLITNQSNGFTASIFPSGNDGYETDLITLVPGENRLHLRRAEGASKGHDQVFTVFFTP